MDAKHASPSPPCRAWLSWQERVQQQHEKRDKLQRASVACFGSVRARALRGWREVAGRQQKMRVALQGHQVNKPHLQKCRG